MPNAVRKQLTGREPVGKTAVVGVKDRATKQVAAKTVRATAKATLQGFVQDHNYRQTRVHTDEASGYDTLPLQHEPMKYSVSEYVRGQAHANGVESSWHRRSGPTSERSPSSARSICTATCRSSPAVTTYASRTSST